MPLSVSERSRGGDGGDLVSQNIHKALTLCAFHSEYIDTYIHTYIHTKSMKAAFGKTISIMDRKKGILKNLTEKKHLLLTSRKDMIQKYG